MSEWADSLEAMETTMGTKTSAVYNRDMQNSTTHPTLIYSLATLLGTSVPRKVAFEVLYLLDLSFSHYRPFFFFFKCTLDHMLLCTLDFLFYVKTRRQNKFCRLLGTRLRVNGNGNTLEEFCSYGLKQIFETISLTEKHFLNAVASHRLQ